MAVIPKNDPEVIALTPSWLVLAKPSGWLTIPGREAADLAERRPSGILLDWAKKRYGELWVVHRIDRETSGVVLLARTAADHRQANLWFSAHQVKKTYDFLAQGVPGRPVLRIARPISGAPSITQVEVRESYAEGFLGRARPLTGRRHQIRIHLSSEGHPLWGDSRYRGPTSVRLGERLLGISRVALHAARLELPEGESFEAPWPEDFDTWVESLRREGHHVGA